MKLATYLSTGTGSGFLRKPTGANGSKRFSTETHRNIVLFLQKSPNISGNLRESTGECNLGILYPSSLLRPIVYLANAAGAASIPTL